MPGRASTIEHVGEWKVALDAGTPEALFACVAFMVAETGGQPIGAADGWEAVRLRARDRATLLADWANDLLGRSEVAEMGYADVRGLSLTDLPDGTVELEAEVRGRPVESWTSPLKAATYHGLQLERSPDGWHAVILFDV